MAGLGEVIVGFILMGIFYITLTTVEIPIIWTGALLGGIVLVLRGFYHMATSSNTSQQTVRGMPLPPHPSRTCRKCGFRNKQDTGPCERCGQYL